MAIKQTINAFDADDNILVLNTELNFLSLIIFIFAGNDPDFNNTDNSFASSIEKLPVIAPFPFGITPLITGAINTLPSRTMANSLPTLFLVISAKVFVPDEFILNPMATSKPLFEGCVLVITSPFKAGFDSTM